MGSMLSSPPNVYLYKYATQPMRDGFILAHRKQQIIGSNCKKIVTLLSKAHEIQQIIEVNHHKVLILLQEDDGCELAAMRYKGIPMVNVEEFQINPEKYIERVFDQRCCPIPIILERFHQSYLKNYMNVLQYYGLNAVFYESVDQFLQSGCKPKYLICSNYQLQQFALKIQGGQYHHFNPSKSKGKQRIQRQNQIQILCFCNKDSYCIPKRVDNILRSKLIDVTYHQNILEIIEQVNLEESVNRQEPSKIEQIYCCISEKDKSGEGVGHVSSRIQKLMRNVKVRTVVSHKSLLEKIKKMQYSILIVTKDVKQYLEICEQLQNQGIQDRVILIRRQTDINQKFIERVEKICIQQKYNIIPLTKKKLIFYGTQEQFLCAIKQLPSLNFKLFLSSTTQKQILRQFISNRNQVILTSCRICECQQQYFGNIRCQVIHFKNKIITATANKSQQRSLQKLNCCDRQKWFDSQSKILAYYSGVKMYSINYPYYLKKASYISRQITEILTKIKEKGNMLLSQDEDSLLLFTAEGWVIDQISALLFKYMSTRLIGSYDHPLMFRKIKAELYAEVLSLRKQREFEESVLEQLEKNSCNNVYELAKVVVELMMANEGFRREVNSIWKFFIFQDRIEYITYTPTLIFILFLAFNKGNLFSYTNETLQSCMLVIKQDYFATTASSLQKFSKRVKNSYIYTTDFIFCEVLKENKNQHLRQIKDESLIDSVDEKYWQHKHKSVNINKTGGNELKMLIKFEGHQLQNFNIFIPVWKKGQHFILPPFTKLELISVPKESKIFKLTMSSQQKFLQKYHQLFQSQTYSLPKLLPCQRQLRRIDAFLQNMQKGKLQTAAYLLKKIGKQGDFMNKQILGALNTICCLKRGDIQDAICSIKGGTYQTILQKMIEQATGGQKVQDKRNAHFLTQIDLIEEKTETNIFQKRPIDQEPYSGDQNQMNQSKSISNFTASIKRGGYRLLNYQVKKKASQTPNPMTARVTNNNDLEVPRNKLLLNRSTSIEQGVPHKKKLTIKISPPSLINFQDKMESPFSFPVGDTQSQNFKKYVDIWENNTKTASEKHNHKELDKDENPLFHSSNEELPIMIQKLNRKRPSNFLKLQLQHNEKHQQIRKLMQKRLSEQNSIKDELQDDQDYVQMHSHKGNEGSREDLQELAQLPVQESVEGSIRNTGVFYKSIDLKQTAPSGTFSNFFNIKLKVPKENIEQDFNYTLNTPHQIKQVKQEQQRMVNNISVPNQQRDKETKKLFTFAKKENSIIPICQQIKFTQSLHFMPTPKPQIIANEIICLDSDKSINFDERDAEVLPYESIN